MTSFRLGDPFPDLEPIADERIANMLDGVTPEDGTEEIVRELAEGNPPLDDRCYCWFCSISLNGSATKHLEDPSEHKPSCLWRRAKALYPEGTW